MIMDKRKLVATAAKKSGYAVWEVNKIVEPFMEAILDTLQQGNDVTLYNFGKFKVKYIKPRRYKHPKSKEEGVIPARVEVAFKAARAFQVNEETMTKLVEEAEQPPKRKSKNK